MSVSPIIYIPDFLSAATADGVFEHLRNNLAWLEVTEARKEYWTNAFDASYTYGQNLGERTYDSQPPDFVVDLVKVAARGCWGEYEASDISGPARWEGCFLNMYENEKNALGWHADDATTIDHTQPIAVVSLGAERPIMFRPIDDKDPNSIVTKMLGHGSLLLMMPGMQQSWFHKIPRASAPCGPRISMTYRSLVNAST